MRAVTVMLPIGALAALLMLAGCEQPPAPTQTAADGTVLIEIGHGIRCHRGQCLQFDSLSRSARVFPFEPQPLPAGVRVNGGVLTEAQFRDLFDRASRAPLGGPEDRRGGAN